MSGNNGLCVIVGGVGAILTSKDGKRWKKRDSGVR
jgi:hypothetical protein